MRGSLGGKVDDFHLPDFFFTNRTHEILDMRVGKMFVVIVHQLAVYGRHCHKHINPWSFRA